MTAATAQRHSIAPKQARLIGKWFAERGGIFFWTSADLSDPSWSVFTPAQQENGQRTGKPHWKANNEPAEHVSDPSAFDVVVEREVKRFHVGLRRGGQGLSFKLTDASTRRVRQALAKAKEKFGDDCWYTFDYSTQDCLILTADKKQPLPEWLAEHPAG